MNAGRPQPPLTPGQEKFLADVTQALDEAADPLAIARRLLLEQREYTASQLAYYAKQIEVERKNLVDVDAALAALPEAPR